MRRYTCKEPADDPTSKHFQNMAADYSCRLTTLAALSVSNS